VLKSNPFACTSWSSRNGSRGWLGLVRSWCCWCGAWHGLPMMLLSCARLGKKRLSMLAYSSFPRAHRAGTLAGPQASPSLNRGAQEMSPMLTTAWARCWPGEGAGPSRSRGVLAWVMVGTQKLLRASVKVTLPFYKGLLWVLWCQALCCLNHLKYCMMDMSTSPGTSQTLVPMLIQALARGPCLF